MASFPGRGNSGPARLRAVLFDLDDTLFDHAHATRTALGRLQEVDATLAAWTLDDTVARHDVILEALHTRVLAGEISVDEARLERFRRLLEMAEARDPVRRSEELAVVYRSAYESGWQPVPGAVALLDAVRARGLRVVIVTNNGVAEQRRKIEFCGMTPRIDALVTSEEVGTPKPAPAIFEEALRQAGVEAGHAVMLGDAWDADVAGALAFGIRPVWFNRKGAPKPLASVSEIQALEPADKALASLYDGAECERV
jgi:putative hydrolase of the HAD superfamily